MLKAKTLALVLLALMGCAGANAQEWDTNYSPATPATDYSYGRSSPASPYPTVLVIEQRLDPWDKLFHALMAHGQRQHEEKMLRLMSELSTPKPPATSTPSPASSTASASSRPAATPAATPTVTSPASAGSAASGQASVGRDWRAELRRVCPSCPILPR